MRKLIIEPIAADSLGVRSFSILVKSPDIRILIDPGIAFAPKRYGLPPHPIELETLDILAKKIEEKGKDVDVIIVTHYHRDHFAYGNRITPRIYENKVILIKNPKKNINPSQKYRRAPFFLRILEKYAAKKVEYADNREFVFNNTVIRCSSPVPHGNDSRLGFVIQVMIEYKGERVLYTSDVEGLHMDEQINFIVEASPQIIFLDGPPIYLWSRKENNQALIDNTIENILQIIHDVKPKYLVMDHHVMRDKQCNALFKKLQEYLERTSVTKLFTSATFSNKQERLLEAYRAELYSQYIID